MANKANNKVYIVYIEFGKTAAARSRDSIYKGTPSSAHSLIEVELLNNIYMLCAAGPAGQEQIVDETAQANLFGVRTSTNSIALALVRSLAQHLAIQYRNILVPTGANPLWRSANGCSSVSIQQQYIRDYGKRGEESIGEWSQI